MTAMIVCIFEHIQWRWARNGSLAPGQASRADFKEAIAMSHGAQ